MTQHKHTNQLANETSPYLLQHAHNPVDWHPWGEAAFEKARRENKPLLISIGYSACHWCHVMERESFENEKIAQYLNETVVPVKVDREERPDVDAIYMNACMAMTGQGGWPLNAFVTPDLKPFFVGTYFPPDDRYGRPGFLSLLERIREAWLTERMELTTQAATLHDQFERYGRGSGTQPISPQVVDRVLDAAANQFDVRHGGFGNAPKFPPDQRLALLLTIHHDTKSEAALEVVTKTLDGMARGGMYDQLGGGFARYSVDQRWLIPHFEKMLYNQALLVPVYLDAFLVTGSTEYRRVAAETLDWVLRDMRSPEGAFYCALDADSEGEEGKFYVWTPVEIAEILGDADAALFCEYYDVTLDGNFEHATSALNIRMAAGEFAEKHGMSEEAWLARLEAMKQKVRAVRSKRVPPATDDKCLTSWNGLMISALCRGWQVLGVSRYLDAARDAANFLLTRQWKDGKLMRSFCKGESRIDGVLDDHAFFIAGLLDLFESSFERRWLDAANEIAETMISRFADDAEGTFYFTSGEDKSLITRTREIHDGALPAGASVAVMSLLRLGALLGNDKYTALARTAFESAGSRVNAGPSHFSSLLLAWRFSQPSTPQIVITGEGDSTHVLTDAVWKSYLPSRSILVANESTNDLPLAKDKAVSGVPAAFVCFQNTCRPPVHTAGELEALLRTINQPH